MLTTHIPSARTARIYIGCALALALAAPAAGSAAVPASTQLKDALQQFARQHPSFPGVVLAVRSPHVSWTGAAGFASLGSDRPLNPSAPFRIASVTKTFVAAATLRLVEERRLDLDEPASRHLSTRSIALLRRGGYAVDRITVRELLSHSAGLYDYASDPDYQSFVLTHGHHHWTRAEQLRFATTHGKPLAPPGREFHYSDTGYILLGEILQRTTGHTLAWALRHLLRFQRVGLRATYLESLEPPIGLPRAHQYYRQIDATGFDPSFDLYGGGGLVSTVDDLARFNQALLGGRLFDRNATLRTMLGKTNPRRIDDLGMGIFSTQIAGHNCWAHSGFWGTSLLTCPDSRTTVALAVNQADRFDLPSQQLLATVLRIIDKQ
jgi:D-alanyl-D-alanine carboxypeptidase